MKCSVIVPVYNSEEYLSRCVDSLLAQTLTDMEIILVNDSSTDHSLDVMERYAADNPDRVVTLTVPHHRQGAARNAGLELAKGDYIGFLDSDDWAEPDMYGKLLSAMTAENADIAVCDFMEWRDEEQTKTVRGAYDNNRLGVGSASNKLFKRSAIGKIRFPADVRYEDFLFSAKIILSGHKMAYVPEPLYNYRIGHTSTMNNANAQGNLDILVIMQKLYTFMLLRKCSEEFDYLLLNQVLIEAVNRVQQMDTPDKQDVLKQLIQYVHIRIPDLDECEAFRKEPLNRRIIMDLNYKEMTGLSAFLLKTKASLKGKH